MIEEKGVGPARGEGKKGARAQRTVPNDFSGGDSQVGRLVWADLVYPLCCCCC